MAKTRDSYQVLGGTVEEIKRNLNFMLQRMADRMDKIEGIRGTSSIESDLDMNSNRVTDLGVAVSIADGLRKDQADLTGANPSVTSLTVSGGNVKVYDSNGVKIHSLE